VAPNTPLPQNDISFVNDYFVHILYRTNQLDARELLEIYQQKTVGRVGRVFFSTVSAGLTGVAVSKPRPTNSLQMRNFFKIGGLVCPSVSLAVHLLENRATRPPPTRLTLFLFSTNILHIQFA
jgi:hypothetical protein